MIKTLDGVKKLLETRILEYTGEISSENIFNGMADETVFALADLYIDIFGKEAFREFIKESKQ